MIRFLGNKSFVFLICMSLLFSFTGCNKETVKATGTYKGQTIIMEQTILTELSVDANLITPYSGGLTCVYSMKEKGFVYVDNKGMCLDDCYKMAYPFETNGRALVQTQQDEWIYIDTQGNKVADGKAPMDNTDSQIYDANERFGVKKADGTILTEPIFEWIEGLSQEFNYAELAEGEHKKVLINRNGQIMILLPDDCIGAWKRKDNVVCKYGDGYKLADEKGKLCSNTLYTGIGNFESGVAPVTIDGKVGLIADDGTTVIAPIFEMDGIVPAYGEGKITGCCNGKLVVLTVQNS